MYEDYLALGGLEIGNSARAFGYTRTAGCSTGWLKRMPCGYLAEALEDLDYDYKNITAAPWYDPTQQKLSTNFLGVYVIDAEGTRDSTLTVQQTEGPGDGGVIGSRRRGMKSVKVKAALVGRGSAAIQYGRAWLDSVLSPGACGQHGVACGVSDFEFFAECPPARASIWAWTDPVETRRNLVNNPAFRVDTSGWAFGGGGGATGTVVRQNAASPPQVVGTGHARLTLTNAIGTWWRILSAQNIPIVPQRSYTFSAWFKGSAAADSRLIVNWRTAAGVSISDSSSPDTQVTGSWIRRSVTVVAPEGAAFARLQVGRSASSAAGEFLDVAGMLFEDSAALGTYFDGETLPDEVAGSKKFYAWDGPSNVSQSIETTRTWIERMQTDAEYAATLDELRRYMHSVALTSGPFTTDAFESENVFVDIVEFTLTSERAWVYTRSKAVDLPSVDAQVVQDVAYNLAQYPSAELSSGAVVATTNLSPNPSVETNSTGWLANSSGLTPAVSGARTTELAAVGTASFKVSTTLTAASTGSPYIQAYQDVSLSGVAANSRVSFSLWGALLLLGGSAVMPSSIDVRVEWKTSGGTVLKTDAIGTGIPGGSVIARPSLAIPAGSDLVRVLLRANIASADAGAQLALYADALAVTVP